MWGNDKQPAPPPSNKPAKSGTSVDTLVGRQTELQGDIRFSGGLHVDGVVKGKIIADSDKNATLSVSESGRIEGDIRVPNLVLNGVVEGDVHATQRISLSPHAKVNGDVYYKIIEMSSGAMVNGQLVHEDEDQMDLKSDKRPTDISAARKSTDDQKSVGGQPEKQQAQV